MSAAFDRQFEEAESVGAQPIPIRPAVAAPGDYPIDALSPKLQAGVRAIIDKVQVPASIAAASVLAAASLAVQAYVDVKLPTGEVVPTSLFFVSVAASGDRKSSTDKLALEAIRQREADMRADYASEQGRFVIQRAAFEASKKKAMAGAKRREEIERALEDCGREPATPALPMLLVDEPTMPAMQRLFAEAMPSLGLFSDEGGTLIGGFAMNEENRVATGGALSKLWDGAPIKRVRASEVITFLPGRRLALHLMVQPRIARKLFGDVGLNDQGLLSRILPCQPTSLRGERLWRHPDDSSRRDLDIFGARIMGLLRGAMPMDPETRELKPTPIDVADDALELYVAWSDAVEKDQRRGGPFEQIPGLASKLPEHSLRIAAVMSYFENKAPIAISAAALAAGIKIARFHAGEALRLYGVGAADDDTENAAAIVAWAREHKLERIGSRLLSRRGPGRYLTGPALKRAISIMLDMKNVAEIKGGADVTFAGETTFQRQAFTMIPDDAA